RYEAHCTNGKRSEYDRASDQRYIVIDHLCWPEYDERGHASHAEEESQSERLTWVGRRLVVPNRKHKCEEHQRQTRPQQKREANEAKPGMSVLHKKCVLDGGTREFLGCANHDEPRQSGCFAMPPSSRSF